MIVYGLYLQKGFQNQLPDINKELPDLIKSAGLDPLEGIKGQPTGNIGFFYLNDLKGLDSAEMEDLKVTSAAFDENGIEGDLSFTLQVPKMEGVLVAEFANGDPGFQGNVFLYRLQFTYTASFKSPSEDGNYYILDLDISFESSELPEIDVELSGSNKQYENQLENAIGQELKDKDDSGIGKALIRSIDGYFTNYKVTLDTSVGPPPGDGPGPEQP